MSDLKYKRILLKLSGEALAGDLGKGIDSDTVKSIIESVCDLYDLGAEIAIVVGGGNFWRGVQNNDIDRVTSDHIGMLATCMNALYVSDMIEKHNKKTRVLGAIEMKEIMEPFIRRRAVRHLEKGRIVIFASGTGNPYFSTDSGAALRAAEIDADIIFKATNVDGVFDKDPNKFSDAKLYKHVTHEEILQSNLKVMDATAAALCRDNDIDIAVFNLSDPQNIVKLAQGEDVNATLVTS